MKDMVSVIVPIYNVEKYLCKCIDSIIQQTYTNLEIILVNDGSTDSSGEICDMYSKLDSRVEVIHKKNEGLSSARNAGLNKAKGEFISFVDSDDYLNIDCIEPLIEEIRKYKVDIVQMKVNIVDENGVKVNEDTIILEKIEDSLFFIQSLLRYEGSASMWDKLYKKELFKNNRFNEKVLNEDFIFWVESLKNKEIKFYYSDIVGYNYLQRSGSISRSGFNKSIIDSVYNAKQAELILLEHYPSLEADINRFILFQLRTFFILIPKEKMDMNNSFYKFSIDLFKEKKKYLFESKVDIVSKMFLYIFSASPAMAKTLLNFLYKNIYKGRAGS